MVSQFDAGFVTWKNSNIIYKFEYTAVKNSAPAIQRGCLRLLNFTAHRLDLNFKKREGAGRLSNENSRQPARRKSHRN